MGPSRYILGFVAGVRDDDLPLLLALTAASSALEHVFPPFPGDVGVTLCAAVGFAHSWPAWGLFLSALGGSLVGTTLAWGFGRWLDRNARHTTRPWLLYARARAQEATASFDRHGLKIIAVSRFVPLGRAFIIVAAGFRAMPLGRVLLAAAAGAVLWNSVLFALAALVGRNLDLLGRYLDRYNRGALAVLVVIAVAVYARRRFTKKPEDSPPA
jgi:membrane protein DedA with SNARE-associated domain